MIYWQTCFTQYNGSIKSGCCYFKIVQNMKIFYTSDNKYSRTKSDFRKYKLKGKTDTYELIQW